MNDGGQAIYKLKHAFRDPNHGHGSARVHCPSGALVPRPRANPTRAPQARYHGVFAPNFKYRLRAIEGRFDSLQDSPTRQNFLFLDL